MFIKNEALKAMFILADNNYYSDIIYINISIHFIAAGCAPEALKVNAPT